MKVFSGQTALVTGASSGIGAEFARALSKAGCHLVLVARREDRLQVLKKELEESYGIKVDVIPADLSTIQGCEDLINKIDKKGLSIDILINNAGFGYEGEFISQSVERLKEMIGLNISTLTFLAKHFGGLMAKKQSGYILLTSSVGAFTPCPRIAVYDATKAYVLLFGEALNNELKKHKVKVTTLCPGATRTEFFDVAGQTLNILVKMTLMSPESVVIKSLKGLSRGKSLVIPGLLNKLTVLGLWFLPRALLAPVAKRVMF
ncbi:MAG: SDR family oxidoreductase [Deltaproteobacteria bacterium]|nr:SDR family oxidoreductase [Deltaproteobacteria bacterium]